MDCMAVLGSASDFTADAPDADQRLAFETVIDQICQMPWETIGAREVVQVAKAYYYFSVQFRENLEIACGLYPNDPLLQQLREGECDTDNLSPWPGVAERGERMNHDEFMRRLLAFQPIDRVDYLTLVGEAYLRRTRSLGDWTRATSIASYEDGGLSRVFTAMLRARDWEGSGPQAFKFFLEQHIHFDTDDDGGHGALARHLVPSDAILPLWIAFRELLVAAVPGLAQTRTATTISTATTTTAPTSEPPINHDAQTKINPADPGCGVRG